MRTEVKAGLIVGLIVIGGVVFYAVKQGGPGEQVDHIPFAVTPEDVGAADQATDQPARQVTRARTPRRRTPTPARADRTAATAPSRDTTADRRRPSGLRDLGRQAERKVAASPETRPATAEPATRPVVARGPGVALPPRGEAARPEQVSARVREARRPTPTAIRHTIVRGDTLYALAREHYGDGSYWTKIREANPRIDPDHLRVGQVIMLPPKETLAAGAAPEGEAGASKPTAGRATYVVERGDTLISIARNVLGDGSRWREIYELNREKIEDPNIVKPGTELRMPPVERAGSRAPSP